MAFTNKVMLGPLIINILPNTTYTLISSGIYNDPQTPLSVLISEDNKGMCINLYEMK